MRRHLLLMRRLIKGLIIRIVFEVLGIGRIGLLRRIKIIWWWTPKLFLIIVGWGLLRREVIFYKIVVIGCCGIRLKNLNFFIF
jgi:hypothetical protein